MDGDGSRLSGRSPRLEGRMPGHRISRTLVLHRDVIPTAAVVERGEPTSASHGIRATRRRLPPQTAGRLHTDVTADTLSDVSRGFLIWARVSYGNAEVFTSLVPHPPPPWSPGIIEL